MTSSSLTDTTYDYPRGWFLIGASTDFPVGEVRPLRYFGEELVAYRDNDGRLAVLDAYCPHMGAHLGHGGKVHDDVLACPFHAWKFDRQGECVDIPYAKRIPKKACVRPWTVDERNGLALIWHDPAGGKPDFDIPQLPEYGREGWTGWRLNRREILTHPREIVENVADVGHFGPVHHLTECSHFENIYDGHRATQIMRGRGAVREVETEATYYGPGVQFTKMRSVIDSRLVNAHTPVEPGKLHLWFGVMIQESEFSEEEMGLIRQSLKNNGISTDFALTQENLSLIHDAIVAATVKGYHEDVAIWENKKYRETPYLCDGDGPILKLRRWYGQFYKALPAAAVN